MTLNYFFSNPVFTLEECLKYNGINFNQISDRNLASDVDFISFEGFQSILGVGVPKIEVEFIENLRKHPSFSFSKENPHLPVLFFHEHEVIIKPVYDLFLKLVTKELGIEPRKIIVYDSGLMEKEKSINPPILSKIRQYKMKTNVVEVEKTKKFALLNNRSRKLRLQILDKILQIYDNDIESLRNENIITFRNYQQNYSIGGEQGPSSDITDFKSFIAYSRYYKFHNKFDFYKKINLPWVADDFKIGHSYREMYKNQNIIYSSSYFSIIPETEYWYLDLDFESDDLDYLAFSEKSLIALSSGNLPFIIHYGEYYKKLEEVGFDFSYLKTLFNIDYRENNLRENFESIENFILYLKENTLSKIEEDYKKLLPIVENNKNILKKIENREVNDQIIDFFQTIKNEKYA